MDTKVVQALGLEVQGGIDRCSHLRLHPGQRPSEGPCSILPRASTVRDHEFLRFPGQHPRPGQSGGTPAQKTGSPLTRCAAMLADQPIETAVGIIEEGTIALNHYRHIGKTHFPPELSQEEHVAQGMSTTGNHLVNAVHLVCEADDPGIKTFLDLPMITGCMGSHAPAQ